MDKCSDLIYKVIENNDFRIEVEVEDFHFFYFDKFYNCKIFSFGRLCEFYIYLLTKNLALKKINSYVEAGEQLYALGAGINISDYFYKKICKFDTLKNSRKVKINVVVDIPYYSQKTVSTRTSLFYEGNFLYSIYFLGCTVDSITKRAIPHSKEFLEIMEKYKNEIKKNPAPSFKPLIPPKNKNVFKFNNYMPEMSNEDANQHVSGFAYFPIALNIINIFIKQNKLENFKHDIMQYKLLETSSYFIKETKGNTIMNIEFWEENIGNNTVQLKFIFRNDKNEVTTYVTLNFNTLLFFQKGMKSLLPEIPEKIIEDQCKYIPYLDERKKAIVKVPIFLYSDFDRNFNIAIYYLANLNKIHLYSLLNFPFFQKFPIFHQAMENIYTSEIKFKCSNYYYDEFCNFNYHMNSRKLYLKLYFELISYTENSITFYKKYTFEEKVVAEIEETISELDPETRKFKQIPKEIYQELQQELSNPTKINTKIVYPPKTIKTMKIEIPVKTYSNDDDTNGYITHIPYLKYAYAAAGIFSRKNWLGVLKVDVGHYRLLDTSMIFIKEIKGGEENIFFEGWEDNSQMPLKSILNLNLKDQNENLLAFVSFEFNPEVYKIGTEPIKQKLISKL